MTIGGKMNRRARRKPLDVGATIGTLFLIGIGWLAIISEMGMGVHQLIK